jgi:hypothetical protein
MPCGFQYSESLNQDPKIFRAIHGHSQKFFVPEEAIKHPAKYPKKEKRPELPSEGSVELYAV